MKTTLKFFTIVIAILFATQVSAQFQGRNQLVSLTVENAGNIECVHTATLIVSYLHNGYGYSQVSNTVTMGHHIPETLVVSIPGSATVLSRQLRIDKNSSVTIHNVTASAIHNISPSQWCIDPVFGPMEAIFFSYLQPGSGYAEILPYVFL